MISEDGGVKSCNSASTHPISRVDVARQLNAASLMSNDERLLSENMKR